MPGNWIIIQARMSSTRLPGKVLLPLGQLQVLDYVVQRCQQVPSADGVIVATTDHPEDQVIEAWCQSRGVRVVRGSKEDVLSRYLLAADTVVPEYIVRVTSDCPFVSYEAIENGLKVAMQSKTDVIRFSTPFAISRGILPEIIRSEVLYASDALAKLERYREHVTLYIWEHLKDYRVQECDVPEEWGLGEYRITLDESDDYRMLYAVALHFLDDPVVATSKVIRFLNNHPEIASINQHVQQKRP